MNRRSFLTKLGIAAVGAAAASIDPERLLWVPGAKTIVDFGATKQVLPATDREVITQATRDLIAAMPPMRAGGMADVHRAQRRMEMSLGQRTMKVEIANGEGLTAFHFDHKTDKLISVHSAEELALLDRPISRW